MAKRMTFILRLVAVMYDLESSNLMRAKHDLGNLNWQTKFKQKNNYPR